MKRLLQFWLRQLLLASRQSSRGFTLAELLIVSIVGSLIITGLMTLTVQLLTTDRQEAVRLETNREMQLALDYMSTELREAVYVYTGDCLTNAGTCVGVDSRAIGNPATAILPAGIAGANNVPVLAFWKQQTIPDVLKTACAAAPAATPLQVGGVAVPCTSGSSYALVVYALSTDNPGNTWEGGARIKRYVLQEFSQTGQRNTGYINPATQANRFVAWPGAGAVTRATGVPPILVDFVNGIPGGVVSCPGGYNISPSPAALAGGGVPNTLRSFYACVSPFRDGQYQEVVVYLQGSVEGRGGGGVRPQDGRLSTLQTRVLTRGVLDAR